MAQFSAANELCKWRKKGLHSVLRVFIQDSSHHSQLGTTGFMEWADEPATWRQIKSLKELGHTLDHRLTKTEAADLIRSLGGRVPAEAAFASESVPKPRQMGAQPLRAKVEAAQRAIAEAGQRTSKLDHELSCAICERQDFWIEACGGSGQAGARSA